jgi:hypothetical protein
MKSWIVGALVGACVGVVLYLVLSQKAAPSQESRYEPPAPPPPAPAAPVAPVVLADVVEVTDIDHLLDPPAKPLSGVPFDGAPTTEPVSIPAGPKRIPPAADGPELAPMPRALPIGLSFDF